ncbi:hypothetical protein PHELEMICH_91 [Mycobacterium phage Phelemich]|uniref:Uncharacterized protein n=2 Tax=Acadianvirus reprobate TaxID=1982903 RepID=S5YDU8_9CAUD|nr:hypothetical protein N847_gp91 [Mycobacterium phage Phelemich]YP_008410014.1 hypothetical protein REPROBATE_93 [Mycobacterium phage Reprobate]AGT12829.1 hypothetical protein REPROBATE_93 [Mycobacterium phage Reprobate]AGT14005.1 hypothetical protein PHELEMICH_91 [Mycobacterium phage Phelemich]
MTTTLIVTLLGITGVLLGIKLIGNAAEGSAREWAGAVIMFTSVLAIPVSAAMQAL